MTFQATGKQLNSASNPDWSTLSQKQYFDKLVECKTTLDELKWSYNLWPKENKTPKPLFADVVDKEKIRQSVQDNLKMQAVLLDYFNFEITLAMLQHDMNRMARNTKDAKRLQEMFSVLDNDPTTIAECVSRPYLVKMKLADQYNYSNQIHAQVKATAQADLDYYLQTENTVAQASIVTYKIQHDNEKALGSQVTKDIELDEQEFKLKLLQLNNHNLQEKDYSFIYTEILQETTDSIKVKTLNWQKRSFNLWLQSQPAEIYTHKFAKQPIQITQDYW